MAHEYEGNMINEFDCSEEYWTDTDDLNPTDIIKENNPEANKDPHDNRNPRR